MTTELVLASASAARATVLRNAGVAVIQDPASIDEATMRDVVRSQDSTVNQAALRLAEAEALAVAMLYPGCLVIGADQILEAGGVWFEKPGTRAAAAAASTD